MQFGTLAGLLLVTIIKRDWLLRAATIIVGPVTRYAAKGVRRLVERIRPASCFPEIVIREGDGTVLGYVSGHSPIAAATASLGVSPRCCGPCCRCGGGG